ncbi:MAG: hypothetical protein Q7U02_01930 [Desulfosalsimonadaceae bacterium]|nr:hypothetical protein [Desulfosalsimonadaceae bacterium]
MDIAIVSMIVLAAALYLGNAGYQKLKAAKSGKTSCGCSGSGCGGCGGGCPQGPDIS